MMNTRLSNPSLAAALLMSAWLAGCKPAPAPTTPTPDAAASAAAPAPTPAPAPASSADAGTPAPAPAPAVAAAPAAGGALYKVVDGYKVDAQTLKGFKTWRSAACDRCHGPNQEGMVGPSLIASLKVLSKDEFVATVTKGRLEKGMPSFATNQAVVDNIDHLYAYLKGRSDGAITRAKVEELPS